MQMNKICTQSPKGPVVMGIIGGEPGLSVILTL